MIPSTKYQRRKAKARKNARKSGAPIPAILWQGASSIVGAPCALCNGATSHDTRKNIAIMAHGSGSKFITLTEVSA